MSTTHIYDGAESPEFEGKEEDLLQSTCILDNHDTYDANYVWSVAVNIKRHIDKQRQEGTQGIKFMHQFPEKMTDDDEDDSEITDSASKWTKDHVIALQVYLVPITNITSIVPQKFIPTLDDIKHRFGDGICNPTVDSAFISNLDCIKTTFPGPNNHQLRVVLQQARALLTKPLNIPVHSVPERFSGALLRSVLEFVGVNDIELSKFEMREELTMTTILGKTEFTARPEFRLVPAADPYTSPIYAWAEDKRLHLPLKSFPSIIAQNVCESISLAVHNRKVRKTQEVYGIGVRHTFFSFWHAAFPCEYLEQISDYPSGLKPNHIVWQKMYPVSEYGLNFCDPRERVEILQLLVGILDYFERGVPQVGRY